MNEIVEKVLRREIDDLERDLASDKERLTCLKEQVSKVESRIASTANNIEQLNEMFFPQD